MFTCKGGTKAQLTDGTRQSCWQVCSLCPERSDNRWSSEESRLWWKVRKDDFLTVTLKFQGNDATWKMEKGYKSLVKLSQRDKKICKYIKAWIAKNQWNKILVMNFSIHKKFELWRVFRWGGQQIVFGLVKVWIIEARIIQAFPWEFVRKLWGDRGISFELVKVRIIRIRIRESWL